EPLAARGADGVERGAHGVALRAASDEQHARMLLPREVLGEGAAEASATAEDGVDAAPAEERRGGESELGQLHRLPDPREELLAPPGERAGYGLSDERREPVGLGQRGAVDVEERDVDGGELAGYGAGQAVERGGLRLDGIAVED